MAELKLIVPKKLPASAMPFPNAAGQQFNSWLVHLPPGHTLEDCLSPAYWAHHATKKFQLHDVIRIVAHDHSFDMQLTVVGKVVGGIRMALTWRNLTILTSPMPRHGGIRPGAGDAPRPSTPRSCKKRPRRGKPAADCRGP